MTQTKKSKIRIGHYNIFCGGNGNLDNIFKIIEKMNLDICGILEAVDWEKKENIIKKYAKDSGFSIYKLAKANSKYNIAILSKIKIKINIIKKEIRHVVLKATIEEGPFLGLSIFFVHLSPVSEKDRLLEVKKIFKKIKNNTNNIIMGDFNSLSKNDPYKETELIKKLRENKITKYGIKKINFEVINEIEKFGLVDASKYLNIPFINTVPTQSNSDINHKINLRIDYVFMSSHYVQKINNMDVIKNKDTEKSSDHYPLLIELKK